MVFIIMQKHPYIKKLYAENLNFDDKISLLPVLNVFFNVFFNQNLYVILIYFLVMHK